jgi:hypothetical protein
VNDYDLAQLLRIRQTCSFIERLTKATTLEELDAIEAEMEAAKAAQGLQQ